MDAETRPLELILARNLLASLTTPAFLVDENGKIAFYNEAAGTLLGRRFEETGPLSAEQWTSMFGPLDESGAPMPYDEISLGRALLSGRPGHDSFCVRSADGATHPIEASGLPIMGAAGRRGAIIAFWPAEEGTS